jgi:hypothetical protein
MNPAEWCDHCKRPVSQAEAFICRDANHETRLLDKTEEEFEQMEAEAK